MLKQILIITMIMLTMNACATHHEGNHYERANQASQKALNRLDRD